MDQAGGHLFEQLGRDREVSEINDVDAHLLAKDFEHVPFLDQTHADEDPVDAVLRTLAGGQGRLEMLGRNFTTL
ncbi:MAG: hypothetical protein AMXMBFR13_32580 [Phycisphaerae bacterium]